LAPAAWYTRYTHRVESSRLPKDPHERVTWVQTVGLDGALLLAALYDPTAPPSLRTLPAVALLRQVWVQQFVSADGVLRLRTSEELPPAAQRIVSPYDAEARTGAKRDTWWDGYKVHLTETVTADGPQLITQVETAPAPEADTVALPRIQQALAVTPHAPQEHLVDAGYVDADLLLSSRTKHQIDLIGPAPADTSWQARAGTGFTVQDFAIDWAQQQVTCPGNQISTGWWERGNHRNGTPEVVIRFAPAACRACAHRPACTTAAVQPRTLTLRLQAAHEALQAARVRQQTADFQAQYAQRAGVEGTIAQGVRTGLRRSRYRGQAKTHLQHILLAVAINLARVVAWLAEVPRATTRTSPFAALAPTTAGRVCV
jgi:transposase